MPIDPLVAIGAELPATEFTWTASDVLLYHLALGAGADPLADAELAYTLEDRLRVLPTFGVVAPGLRTFEPPTVRFPGIEIDLAKVLHGSQQITVHQPIPVSGRASANPRIADVWDKEKAAVIVQETVVTDSAGVPLWTATSSIYARGEGGFGGSRGPSERATLPDRLPDHLVDTPTLPQQALIYRLCGDRNPLHADPAFAATAGFPRPILHGLCTWGMVCKAVVDTVFGGDVTRVGTFSGRFAGVVFPGETLRTRVWADDGRLTIAASTVERGDDVLRGSLQ
ncbi:MAG TPA: MaoC/PaaZ C-terminal domain-containing protein [Actinophytocola sp.]|uniref:MaoC/PaaZ C-terminal domain-containing protein n=1 Tax=Actinophytocola sp. TaxID=1872138 RepID=UPI002DC02BAA|nr:MaoC/PaaZ C-terminal domain-containing protein [Actinophytocola sp.]HEU5474171.1 MaoC/PaaZ C-terminal domain-containing protein [Actinophytocola sp.]